ncbi:hypothetical protein DL96DRAFT_1686755 [Flagelloscypha sp. PMI_526]|nr:hypothetical protein DL96DRAFT_1686755 [Flagelloscypha sp. PMI_526]
MFFGGPGQPKELLEGIQDSNSLFQHVGIYIWSSSRIAVQTSSELNFMDEGKQRVKEWLVPLAWVLAITVAAAAYNIGACALGRFSLDHFHLWNRRIPSNASSLDKHTELYAALLATCLSAPVSLGLIYAIFNTEAIISRRYWRFTIVTSLFQLAGLIVLVEWNLIPISAAIIHPKYQYVNSVSILGCKEIIYGYDGSGERAPNEVTTEPIISTTDVSQSLKLKSSLHKELDERTLRLRSIWVDMCGLLNDNAGKRELKDILVDLMYMMVPVPHKWKPSRRLAKPEDDSWPCSHKSKVQA